MWKLKNVYLKTEQWFLETSNGKEQEKGKEGPGYQKTAGTIPTSAEWWQRGAQRHSIQRCGSDRECCSHPRSCCGLTRCGTQAVQLFHANQITLKNKITKAEGVSSVCAQPAWQGWLSPLAGVSAPQLGSGATWPVPPTNATFQAAETTELINKFLLGSKKPWFFLPLTKKKKRIF